MVLKTTEDSVNFYKKVLKLLYFIHDCDNMLTVYFLFGGKYDEQITVGIQGY